MRIEGVFLRSFWTHTVDVVEAKGHGAGPLPPAIVSRDAKSVQCLQHARPAGASYARDRPGG